MQVAASLNCMHVSMCWSPHVHWRAIVQCVSVLFGNPLQSLLKRANRILTAQEITLMSSWRDKRARAVVIKW